MGTSTRKQFEDRARGCLLGAALGDALGAPVEFKNRWEIYAYYGPQGIDGLKPWGEYRAGSYTDDTQMTIDTARGILNAKAQGLSLTAATWAEYRRWLELQRDPFHRRAPGNTCLAALEGGTPGSWMRPRSCGSGWTRSTPGCSPNRSRSA